MKKFFRVLLCLAIIAGGLYGAWVAVEIFDDMQTSYREELLRSQLLNLGAQQRITELLSENARLQAELDLLRAALPAFAEIEIEEEPPSLREVAQSAGGSNLTPPVSIADFPLEEGD